MFSPSGEKAGGEDELNSDAAKPRREAVRRGKWT
jgi:hypothetical protein